jgi:NAD(P)-dependent dehydrogenase (short-subunit alcohol dehydrogenase family)
VSSSRDRLRRQTGFETGKSVDLWGTCERGLDRAGFDRLLTPEHFDKTFNLNARAPVFLVQKLLALMTGGGSIVLVSSG